MRDYNDEFVADVFKVLDYKWIAVNDEGLLLGFSFKLYVDIKGYWSGCGHIIVKVNLNDQDWRETLRERPRVVWVPKVNDEYYLPDIFEVYKHIRIFWKGNMADKKYLERGLVNQTPEQAIAMTDKMLEVAKNINEGK